MVTVSQLRQMTSWSFGAVQSDPIPRTCTATCSMLVITRSLVSLVSGGVGDAQELSNYKTLPVI